MAPSSVFPGLEIIAADFMSVKKFPASVAHAPRIWQRSACRRHASRAIEQYNKLVLEVRAKERPDREGASKSQAGVFSRVFERYTEKARRVIFFARYEASQYGSPYMDTEHLLLGILREDKALTRRFLRSPGTGEMIRRQIDAHTTIREQVPTSVDLPLSDEFKRILAYAAEEAELLAHKHIGTEHLFLGLLREEKCFPAEVPLVIGERMITVTKQGYRPWRRMLQVLSGGKQTISAELEQLPQ